MIYGTAWKKEKTADLVQTALECGFRRIDTACQPKHYNEAGVGEGIIASAIERSELTIQTKFTPVEGQDRTNIPYNPSLPFTEQVMESFHVSQENLKTEIIDSYLLHSTMMPLKPLFEIWHTMENLVKQENVKKIGVSNCYDIALLERLYSEADIKPSVVQNRFDSDTNYDKEIRQFCRSNDIEYQAFWSLTANPYIVHSYQVSKIAHNYSMTNEQIFYRFLTQIGITPLNGTTSTKHMTEDLQIYNFELEENEVETINKLLEL